MYETVQIWTRDEAMGHYFARRIASSDVMADRGLSMCRSSAHCNTVTMVTCPQVQTNFHACRSMLGAQNFVSKNSKKKKKVPKLVTVYQILGSHGAQYEGYDLVGCDALQFGR